jgi:hypothetical protein
VVLGILLRADAFTHFVFEVPALRLDRCLEGEVPMRWVVLLGFAQAAYVLAIAWELNFGATDAEAVHIDFVAFWAAARLALWGNAMAAFDPSALVAAQSLGSEAAWEAYV